MRRPFVRSLDGEEHCRPSAGKRRSHLGLFSRRGHGAFLAMRRSRALWPSRDFSVASAKGRVRPTSKR